jgi:hypothetical protein
MPQIDPNAPVNLDPAAPEYAGIRADLGRLFLQHKDELGMADWTDADIVAQVNDIAGALMMASTHAVAHGDRAWLDRHAWFSKACERLFADKPAVPLDG